MSTRAPARWWLFGAAAGIAIAAASIGLLLIGVAAVTVLQTAGPPLQGHPLFVAGCDLVRSSFVAALPVVAVWIVWRPR